MTSGCVLALLRNISSFHGSLFPHLKVSRSQIYLTLSFMYEECTEMPGLLLNLTVLQLSSEDMIAEFSQVLDW